MDAEQPDLDRLRHQIDQAGAGWQAEMTPDSQRPLQQKRLRLGYDPGPGELTLPERESVSRLKLQAGLGVPITASWPVSHDLRNVGGKNYITSVKDQGYCGSCVAFGAVGAMEGTVRVARKAPGLRVDYSEAQLFYCYARAEGSRCDTGWWPDSALDAIRTKGLVNEACYPYVPGDQACSGLCKDSSTRLTKIASWRMLDSIHAMKAWLAKNGPLVTCFTVYDDFYAYSSGVYRHVSGDIVGGHCVCVVGYSDSGHYWICKNSWGNDWGEKGFFRIGYGECGIDADMWTVEGVRSPYEEWTSGPYFGSKGSYFADVTGDGKADAIVVNAGRVTVRRSTGRSFGPNEAWTAGAFYGSKGTFFADVTGDGKADAIAVNTNKITVRRSTGSRFGPNEAWTTDPFFGSRGTFFVDLTGDGKADAIAVNDDTVLVRRSTGAGFGPVEDWTHGPFYGSRGTLFADVTGDGKADAIAINDNAVTIRRSTGNGFRGNEQWTQGPFFGSLGTYFADLTGDGKSDAIAINHGGMTVRSSTGTSFGSKSLTWSDGPFTGTKGTFFADTAGSGKKDLIAVHDESITVWFSR